MSRTASRCLANTTDGGCCTRDESNFVSNDYRQATNQFDVPALEVRPNPFVLRGARRAVIRMSPGIRHRWHYATSYTKNVWLSTYIGGARSAKRYN